MYLLTEVTTLLKLALVIPASTATAERSFSGLRRLKTYLRSTMTAKRLNHVMTLNVHRQRTDTLDANVILKEFLLRKPNRKDYFGVC